MGWQTRNSFLDPSASGSGPMSVTFWEVGSELVLTWTQKKKYLRHSLQCKKGC